MAKKKIGKINTEDLEMFGNGGYTTGPVANHADSVLNYKNSKAQEAAFKAIKMETIDLATFKGIRKMIKDKYPDDPRIENINPNVVNYISKPTLPTNHEYGVLQIRGQPPMPSVQSVPKPLPTPKPKPRPTTPSVTAPIIKAVDKIKSVVERPISTPQRQLVYGERPPAPIVEDKPTGGYMDSRGVMMDKPQTAGNYTPEQLVKMGYRAKQSNVTLPNNKMKYGKGGLLKGIGGALYGVAEGGLDSMSMGLTDQITDAGANAIGGKDKTFNASRAGGNIAGAVGMDALTMGATHAGTVQQVAKGTNGLVQNTNIFGSNDKKNIGMGIDIFRATAPLMGGIEEGNVTSEQIFNSIQGTSQAVQNNNIQKQEQGGMNNTTINVEGSGIQSGQKASMKKGELLTSNGMVLRNFINIPPHPTDPNLINPDGTVQAPAGTTVIPKNRTKEYMERDLKGKQQLEKSLISAQKLRERKEIRMGKGGAAGVGKATYGASYTGDAGAGAVEPGTFSDMDPTMSALNILPIAWKFGKGIFGKADHSNPEDYMVNDRLKWNDLSNDQVQRKVNEGYNLGRYNMRNSGNYNLAGDVALGTNLMKTKAEEQEKIMNINAEGKFKADASNIDLIRSNMATKLTVDDMNAKNKAMKTDYLNSGFEDIGKIGAFGLQKDYINNYMKKAYPKGYKKGGKVK